MEKLISVIIPVYKVEQYLDKCVESVVSQTYKNLEIILVDDGSPDNCPAMCDEWAKKDSRIKVIHKKNGGVADARNIGIDNATGDYIAFVDSDDYLDKTMYEKLLICAMKNNSDMTMCRYLEVYDSGKLRKVIEKNLFNCNSSNLASLYVNTGAWVENGELYTNGIHGNIWRVLYKKGIINNTRFYLMTYGEDFCFNLLLSRKKPKIAAIDEFLYFYYQRETSVVHVYNEKSYYAKLQSSKITAKIIEQLLTPEKFCSFKFSQCIQLLVIVSKNKDYKKVLKEYRKDSWVLECNTKKNYKQAQVNAQSFSYKVANWFVYKKLYRLFCMFYKLIRRKR